MLTSDGSLWNETEVYSSEAASYFGELAVDGNGNLFGAARDGGQNGGGPFFKLAHDTFAETTLYQFCQLTNCADGANSTAPPVIDGQGDLYSTTVNGGLGGGVAFRLAPHNGGYTYNAIHDFCSTSTCNTGEVPSALTMDGNDDLFGTTVAGIESAARTVFWLHNGSHGWAELAVYIFCFRNACKDGSKPQAGVVLDAAGHVFGTTSGLGKYNGGNVFEVTP